MQYINLDGKIVAAITAGLPADNGAFRYGYGLFETMLVQGGVVRLAQYHWQRLFEGLGKLGFELPARFTASYLQQQVLALAATNGAAALCRVRLQVYAAGGGLYGRDRRPGFVIECFGLEPDTMQLNENGLVAGIAQGLQKSPDSLANLKTCNALIYAMAARQAQDSQWNDALVCNTAGHIIESTIANIFWIKGDEVYTPPLTDGCIAGVMRRHTMAMLPVTECSLTPQALLEADEVFLTNAIKKIRWVGRVGDKEYGNRRIMQVSDKALSYTF
ncbi:MAG: aminotransferase class IV [Bacteroidota bacterium]